MSRPNDSYDVTNGGIVKWLRNDLPNKRLFFEQINYKPHKGQVQIHAALDMADTVIVAAGARCGKSTSAAGEMVYEAMLPREKFTGWTVAPTTDLADIIFEQVTLILQEYFRPTPGVLIVRQTDGELVFPNFGGGRSHIYRKTTHDAADKGKLAGRGIDFMICDEAAKIRPDSIWEQELRARLVDRCGKVLHISTPMGNRGWFPTLFRKGQTPGGKVVAIRMPSWMNPMIPKERWIEEREASTQRAWDQEYAAKFVNAEGNVFDESCLMACATGELEDPQPGVYYYAATDVAMVDDYTVCIVMRADPIPKVVALMRFRKVPVSVQQERIARFLERYNHAPMILDSSGMGQPFIEGFQNQGVEVRPKNWGIQSKKDMTNNAVLLIERQRCILPKPSITPELIHELGAYGWKNSGGHEVGEAPQGQHDDCVSAFIMCAQWFRGAGKSLGADTGGKVMPRPGEVVRKEADEKRIQERIEGFASGKIKPGMSRRRKGNAFGLGRSF